MQKNGVVKEYRDVALDLIDEPDGRIRLAIDDEGIESLSESIKEVGQIQPINLAIHGKRFEIIAGQRRFLAIKKLGHKTIKAIVKAVPKKEIALVRASENLKRQNLSPIEEAATYADLIDQYQMTKMEVANKFGIAASSVKRHLDLLALHPDIQKLIHTRQLFIHVGVELNKIDNERQLQKSLRDALQNGCSIETARIWVLDYQKSLTYEPSNTKGASPPDPEILPTKIYQACELCEKPVEIEDMKVIRVCQSCYNIIAANLKGGGE